MQFPEIVVITEVRARAFWPITPSRRPQSRPLEGNFVDKEISPRVSRKMWQFLTDASLSFSAQGDDGIKFTRADDSRKAREGHGLYRTLANNMMVGVATGFEKKLKLVGVGYKAAMEGSKAVNLSLGYAHPVILEIPEGLQVKCDSPTEITVSGYDKVEVGNFAAIIRSKRKPEPYKGKGVRYADEVVLIKEGKRK